MKIQSLFQNLVALLLFSCFLWQHNANAQSGNLLYGVTSQGGINNGGIIFHIDPATGIQTVDCSLPTFANGYYPEADLTVGSNGKFYGMTAYGGSYNLGVIFEWDPITNIYIKKIDFNGTDGSNPEGSLTLNNGKFYGMTNNGGYYNKGVIFEWDPATNIYVKKRDFNDPSGRYPYGNMTLSNGKLYGMTVSGGTNNRGVIFEWDPATNIYTKKIDLNITIGCTPFGSLTLSNGKFYGMTFLGGASDKGVIFEWDPSTNIYAKKKDFDGISGCNPVGDMTIYNGKLYGMTRIGGTNNNGVLFEWNPTTNIYTKKKDLAGINGNFPEGSLALNNGKFYGTTYYGGVSNFGVIFEWDPVTNIYAKKKDFDRSNGSYPLGSLTVNNGKLYGMASQGGLNDEGVIFEWDPSTTLLTKKIDFEGSAGSHPLGTLTIWNGKLYGMTQIGGTIEGGVIFEWDPANNLYTRKISFNDTSGAYPSGSLTLYNEKFYGMTSYGIQDSAGAIFEWDPSTNIYTKKTAFNWIDGCYPIGSLTLYNGKFYGMASEGGLNNSGVIFEWDPATNIYTKKVDFNGTNGGYPCGSLTPNNGKLYGMTVSGGTNSKGVIFEWDPLTNVYTKKVDFNDTNGSYPYGSLTFNNGKFYGMASGGGLYGMGIIFQWNPVSNIYTKKVDLDETEGATPQGSLTLNNGKFYGMTKYAGWGDSTGVIFEWDPNTNLYTNLLDFNSTNGSKPVYTQFTVLEIIAPATQATSIIFSNVQTVQMNINWTNGNGTKRAVFIKQDVTGSALPVNNTTYTANTAYGSGSQIGSTGWYCIFNDDAHPSGVTVTNLLPNAAYRVMVCEYNGIPSAEQYNTLPSLENPANQATLSSSFIITVSSSPSSGGTTTGGGTYIEGMLATVSASPNIGWLFVNWTENGNIVSSDPAYSFTVTGNRTLIANFIQQQFTISTVSNPLNAGTTSGGGTFTYGTTVIVVAIANTNWLFLNWTENGNIVSTNPSYSFTLTANRTLIANFSEQVGQYIITATANPTNGGYTNGAGAYNLGVQATVNAFVNNGWSFFNWTEYGSQVSTDPSYTFTVTGNRDLTANFLQQFNITASASPLYGGYTSGGGSYTSGQVATLQAFANPEYTFYHWTENGNVVSSTSLYTFTVTNNRALAAIFLSTVGIAEKETSDFAVYPNPASKQVTVEVNHGYNNHFVSIQFMNTAGQILVDFDGNQISEKTLIDISGFADGFYILKIRMQDGVQKTYSVIKK